MPEPQREVLYVVDTFSLVFQVFHGIPGMTSPKGLPTNAVFGFTRDLFSILEDKRPTYFICAMDSAGPGVRNDIYADYKANRDEMPDDLQPQVPLIQDVIEGFCLPAIGVPGWEADDVFATVTRQAAERGIDVRIVTNDKDARQLLGPHVQLYNARKGQFLDADALEKDWGVRPDQVVDFQALVGDTSDNVPGVPLVGPKKAGALLKEFGTLDEILKNADKAPGKKLRENLKTFAEQAQMSRELVKLNTGLPIEVDWDAARVKTPDYARLLDLFTDLGFRRFSEQVRDAMSGTTAPPTEERTWEVVDSAERFETFVERLREQKSFCVDLETTGLDALRADIVGWAFSWKANQAYYIPVDAPSGQATLNSQTVLETLRPILEDPAVEVSNQNIKYDMLVLRRAGVELQGVGVDPMVGHYLLDAGARGHGLDALAMHYLGHKMTPISDLIGKGKRQKKMFEVDVDRAAEYATEDADVAWQLAGLIADELKRESLWDLYWDLERPLITVLADVETAGVQLDVDELRQQSQRIGIRLTALVQEIHELAGREFNIDSPIQLRQILFDELSLPVQKRTKTGASTSHDVLEKLALLHPLPAKIIEHRQLAKLKGTYLDALPELINPETGKLHTSFNQVVAATGRLSSSDPNLQNIPIRRPEGRQVRRAFRPSQPGWKLVCADYSQIELRMLAHFCEDPVLVDAFQQGADIHTAVASELASVPPEQVDPEMRRVAKAVNFGVIYGQSPFGLSQALGIDQPTAAEFIDNYFARHSGVDRYFAELLDECAKTGYARTILGRRRAISGIRNTYGRQRNLPERTAINTVIQGSAADLIKRAMINVHNRLDRESHPGRMLLQIHDELVFEVPADQVPSLISLVRDEMEHAMELSVPLVVDVSVGENWLDTEKWPGESTKSVE